MKTLIITLLFRFDHFFLFTEAEKVMKEGIMKVQEMLLKVSEMTFQCISRHEC
jgi:hypothetical protein